jgi:T5SS/PEP-CTERM-associated repeat protein/autotransporter-associated beta strand protein
MHTPHLPHLLTAAAALAATAPFAAADFTYGDNGSPHEITGKVSYDDNAGDVIIEGANNPTVKVYSGGELNTGETKSLILGKTADTKGTLNIATGGIVTSSTGLVGENGTGTATVKGYWETGIIGVGFGNGSIGTLDILNGGKVSIFSSVEIGAESGSTGTVTVSGKDSRLEAIGIFVGNGGNGTLNISNGGTVIGTGTVALGLSAGSTSVLNLLSGGTLAAPVIAKNESNNVTLNLNGGTIRATAGNADFTYLSGGNDCRFDAFPLNGAGLSSSTPALIFDTDTHDVGITVPLTGNGGFEKAGTGTLKLSAANTYTGVTIVSGGTLEVLDQLNEDQTHAHAGDIVLSNNGKIVFHQTDTQKFSGVLSGTGTIAFDTKKSVVIAGTGTLRPGSGLASTPGALTFENVDNVTLENGATFAVFLAALTPAGNDFLLVEGGNLVLDGSQLEILRGKGSPLWGAKEGSEIVIAKVTNGGEITGMFANVDPEEMSVTDASGRKLYVSVRANADGGQDLLLTMFPEPSTYALLGGTGTLLLALFRRRRQRARRRTENAGL